jgi:hypothetical protein
LNAISRNIRTTAAQVALSSLNAQARQRYLDHRNRANRGRAYLQFLRLADPTYPIVLTNRANPQQHVYDTTKPTAASPPTETKSPSFSDFREFLQAYDAYLSDGTMRRVRLPDPLYGLDPAEGLMSATEVLEHCRQELIGKVQFHERAALEEFRRGLEESNARLARYLFHMQAPSTSTSTTSSGIGNTTPTPVPTPEKTQ